MSPNIAFGQVYTPENVRKAETILRRENYNLRLWILTFAGSALEALILLPALPELPSFIQTLIQYFTGPNTTIQPVPTSQWEYLIIFYLAPIVFCIPASLAFTPKRIVSPMNILIGAASGYTIIYASYTIQFYGFANTAFTGLFLWLLLFVLALVVGLPEAWLIKLLVGLNGDLDSLSLGSNPARKTYILAVPFEKVRGVISDPFNLDVWDMPRPRKKKSELVFQSWSDRQIQRLFIVRPLDANNTEIATVAYEKAFYSIFQSEVASRHRDRVIRDICDQLNISAERRIGTEDTLSLRAVEKVLAPTRSVFAPISEASKFYLGVIILTILLLVLTSYEFLIHPENEFWVSSTLVILIAFVVELGPSVKDYLESRVAESEED